VLVNGIVNNATNFTLLLGLPALIWPLRVVARGARRPKKDRRDEEVNRLSLLFSLAAALFFTGVVWALGRDGVLDFSDGLVLIGTFVFWQCASVFETLKTNVREERRIHFVIVFDFALLGVGAVAQYLSIEWLVSWLEQLENGLISARNLGWLSGWLMVVPNGLLALFYAARRRPEVVYSSQIGDGHICIPLCIGIFAIFSPIPTPPLFHSGLLLIACAAGWHMLAISLFGGISRAAGILLIGAYGWFLFSGFF